jgi:hypothetical protein
MGFRVGTSEERNVLVPHLLFSNDTLIFCEADSTQVEHLRFVFTWFEATFGLKINLSKSEIVHVGNVLNLEELILILGCKTASLPMKYLGLPLGAHFMESTIWNPIIEKMERHLAGWKRLYLSKGGKVTFVKSTLTYPHISFLSSLSRLGWLIGSKNC